MHSRNYKFGTKMGRLQYRTSEEASKVAKEMGLSGTHSHTRDGERVHMPGTNHKKLNSALEQRGLPPTPVPGEGGGMMGGMMGGGGGNDDLLPDTEPVDVDVPDPEPMMSSDMEMEIDIPGDGGMLAGDEDDDDQMELY